MQIANEQLNNATIKKLKIYTLREWHNLQKEKKIDHIFYKFMKDKFPSIHKHGFQEK